jgi:iron complex outermembrane receptor protein
VYDRKQELDSLYTNEFIYRETINALYPTYNRAFKGWLMQAGIRMENTHISGNSTGFKWMNNQWNDFDSTFSKQYTVFFPSVAIT